jgi:hypothetical protein
LLVPHAKTGDRRVIRNLVRRQHAKRDILATASLDPPAATRYSSISRAEIVVRAKMGRIAADDCVRWVAAVCVVRSRD